MDVLSQLRQLIFRLNRADIATVPALLKCITADQIAAIMLARLLYWLPKSQTGWVFKSWRDWEAECGLSRAQIKRIHNSSLLEAVGVQRQLRKARGAPTVHYRVDLDVLFEKIAAYRGVVFVMSLRSSKNTAADNEIIITPYFRALLSFPAISWRYPDWSLRDTLRPKEVLRSVPLGVDASAR